MKNRKHYTVGTIPRYRGNFQWMCYILIMRSSIIPILCLFPRSRVAERGKLYHTYCIFMFYIVCIRKRETASYLQYIYVLDLVYQKERNCIIPTVYLCSILCVSERGKLHHTYSIFMFQIQCIRKRETVSYQKYVYALYCVYQTGGSCIIHTVCLCSRFCVSERGKLYHTYNMFMLQILCICKGETVSYLQYDYVLDFVYQKEEKCIIPTSC